MPSPFSRSIESPEANGTGRRQSLWMVSPAAILSIALFLCGRTPRALCSFHSLSLFILFHFYYVCCARVYGGQYRVNFVFVFFFAFSFYFFGETFTAPALSSLAQQHRQIHTNARLCQITIAQDKRNAEGSNSAEYLRFTSPERTRAPQI